MPIIQLFTNVSSEKLPADLNNQLTNVLAQTLEKPLKFCAVHILPGFISLLLAINLN